MEMNLNLLNNLYKDLVIRTDELGSQVEALHNFGLFLLIVMIANILVIVLKYFFDRQQSKLEAKLQRNKLIFEQSIELEKRIFMGVDALSDYSRELCSQMIEEVNKLRNDLNTSKLFIEDEVYAAIDNLLNYFTEIAGDFRKKNYEMEVKLKSQYIKAFRG